MYIVNYEELTNKKIKDIEINNEYDYIKFIFENGEIYKMYHEQDCCETVYIKEEDLSEVRDQLIGATFTAFEERTDWKNDDDEDDEDDEDDGYVIQWTFYHWKSDNNLSGVLSWEGVSNGYYSTSVWVEKEEDDTMAILNINGKVIMLDFDSEFTFSEIFEDEEINTEYKQVESYEELMNEANAMADMGDCEIIVRDEDYNVVYRTDNNYEK